MSLRLSGSFGSFNCIDQQHRDGHWPHATRHGGDITGDFLGIGKIDIAAQFAVIVTIHTDIDDNRTWFDHVGSDDVAFAGSYHQDIGLAGMVAEIAGLGVTDSDSGACLQEQHRLRFANNIGRTDDDGVGATHRIGDLFQHFHHAIGGARAEQRLSGHQ